MAVVELVELTAPVPGDDACGPDLDLAGDADFMNFMARAEGLIPSSFFSGPDGAPFDRNSIKLADEVKNAQPFLAQTRDLRLLVLLAKFSMLTRDFDTFVVCTQAIGALLESQWDGVHPRGEGGEFAARTAVIETLNDSAPIVIPLQFVTLVQSKRAGAINYRHVMLASGEVQPRENEETVDRGTIDKALMEADLDGLIALRGRFETLQTTLNAIVKLCNDRVSAGQSISLERLTGLAGKIFGLLNDVVSRRDPSAAVAAPVAEAKEPGAADAVTLPAGLIRSNADVAAALAAIDGYFCRYEPSNPALLLVRQAQQLMGKSFLEVMQILVPTHVAEAKFRIGGEHPFEIPIESLSSLATVEQVEPTAYVNGGDSGGDVPEGETEGEGGAPPAQQLNGTASLKAGTRQEAFALLEQIGVYYRVAEPSSPISFITERARSYINRDFLALLKDLLPAPPAN